MKRLLGTTINTYQATTNFMQAKNSRVLLYTKKELLVTIQQDLGMFAGKTSNLPK